MPRLSLRRQVLYPADLRGHLTYIGNCTIFKQKIQVALFSPVILFIVSRETFFCVSPFYVSRETFSQIKAFNNAAAPAATRFL